MPSVNSHARSTMICHSCKSGKFIAGGVVAPGCPSGLNVGGTRRRGPDRRLTIESTGPPFRPDSQKDLYVFFGRARKVHARCAQGARKVRAGCAVGPLRGPHPGLLSRKASTTFGAPSGFHPRTAPRRPPCYQHVIKSGALQARPRGAAAGPPLPTPGTVNLRGSRMGIPL